MFLYIGHLTVVPLISLLFWIKLGHFILIQWFLSQIPKFGKNSLLDVFVKIVHGKVFLSLGYLMKIF